MITEAVKVDITVYRKPLKSWTKKQMKEYKQGKILPVTRPDVDNYAKSLIDGMNGVVFKDDSQICDLTVRKRYGEEKAVVRIETIE